MLEPSLPPNEDKRLAALRSLQILDTPYEDRFDRLTRLASQIFDVPISLVSLIDSHRQWFKSCMGLTVTETSRAVSMCGHAILTDDLFVVSDAKQDVRFADNPLVTHDPQFRFYAGQPLAGPGGHKLGTICIIDHRPRSFKESELKLLGDLGNIAENELNHVELNVANKRLLLSEEALKKKNEDLKLLNAELHREIKNRMEAEEDRHRFFDLSFDLICVAGFNGYFSDLSRSWEKTLGWTQKDLLSKPYIEFVHPDDQAATMVQAQKVASGGEMASFENRFICKDGRFKWFHWTAIPHMEGEKIYAVGRDLTEMKRTEGMLRSKNEQLKSFAFTISHDLKTPLRGISGYARELLNNHQEGLGKRPIFCLEKILSATRKLDTLIEDLLHYSKLETQRPEPKPVQIKKLVQGILEDQIKSSRSQHRVDFSLDIPFETLTCWEQGMAQVFNNLFENAVKYSRKSNPPKIEIKGELISGGVRFEISDNGIGFPMKQQEKIWQLFTRLVNDEDYPGTGAGLAIVKKLVEKQGGKIWVESQPGKGTRFFVEVPS